MNERFERAILLIDNENSRDPRKDIVAGQAFAYELIYSQRVTDWVLRLDPQASESLRLAARSQHIARWEIPRARYAEGRAGYLRWRNDLKAFHAARTTAILREVGYGGEIVDRVRALNLKETSPGDADVQTLEDALCLVFLQYQLSELMPKLPPDRLINAVRKSWNKMSVQARKLALELSLGEAEKELLARALAAGQGIS